jgi:hypothetical protein
MAAITKLAHSAERHTSTTGERCDGLIGCWQLMAAKGKLLISSLPRPFFTPSLAAAINLCALAQRTAWETAQQNKRCRGVRRSHCSRLTRKRGAFDMSRAQPQCSRTGPLQNCHRNSQPRNIHTAWLLSFVARKFMGESQFNFDRGHSMKSDSKCTDWESASMEGLQRTRDLSIQAAETKV